ncbi:MAG: hypothetical protein WDZ83_11810 [Rhizobiaceae bacterium]
MNYVRKAITTIAGLLALTAVSHGQSSKPYTRECGIRSGIWTGGLNDMVHRLEFLGQGVTSGRYRISATRKGMSMWTLEGDYQCSMGVGFCYLILNSDEYEKSDSGDYDSVRVDMFKHGDTSFVYLNDMLEHTVLACRLGNCEDRMNFMGKEWNRDYVVKNNGDISPSNYIGNLFYLTACKDDPDWKFVDSKAEISKVPDDNGELLYERGYCELKSRSLSFHFFPKGTDSSAKNGGIVRIYAQENFNFKNAAMSVDQEDPYIVIQANDNGYLGDYYYVRYSDQLFGDIASGANLYIKDENAEILKASLSGSVQPARQFEQCVRKYKR